MPELSLQLLFGLSIQLLCLAAKWFHTQIKRSELLIFVGTEQQAESNPAFVTAGPGVC